MGRDRREGGGGDSKGRREWIGGKGVGRGWVKGGGEGREWAALYILKDA